MEKEIKYPKGKPMKVLVGSEFELQILLLNAKKEVFDDVEKLVRQLAGDFGEVPIYKDYQELKKKHLGKKGDRRK